MAENGFLYIINQGYNIHSTYENLQLKLANNAKQSSFIYNEASGLTTVFWIDNNYILYSIDVNVKYTTKEYHISDIKHVADNVTKVVCSKMGKPCMFLKNDGSLYILGEGPDIVHFVKYHQATFVSDNIFDIYFIGVEYYC